MASIMRENDAPISRIQELLGHSLPTVTCQVYAAYEQRTLRKHFDNYNPTASQQVPKLEVGRSSDELKAGQVPTDSHCGMGAVLRALGTAPMPFMSLSSVRLRGTVRTFHRPKASLHHRTDVLRVQLQGSQGGSFGLFQNVQQAQQ